MVKCIVGFVAAVIVTVLLGLTHAVTGGEWLALSFVACWAIVWAFPGILAFLGDVLENIDW